jgi:hypothetical protein
MTGAELPAPPALRSSGSPRWALGLLAAPLVTAGALAAAPSIALGPAASDFVTFAGGASTGVLALGLSARAALAPRAAVMLALACVAGLGAIGAARPAEATALVLVNGLLVALAHAVGGSIGRRVAHPGHLLPACVVAACADLASVVHPAGPTHAIAASERALALLTIGFAVPGSHRVAPVLGAGDLVFLALVLGVAAAHGLSVLRASLLGGAGMLAAGLLSALVGAPVPALVTIGAAVTLGLPAARRLRPEDRRTAALASATALALLAGLLVQRLAAGAPPPANEPSPAGSSSAAAP